MGVIIRGYTVAIISNGTLHPLDPLLSVHLLKQCNHRTIVGCCCANLLREVIEARIHSLLLNRIYAPSHLQRGGVPKMSDNNNNNSNTNEPRSSCVQARTRRASQNRFTLSNLK